MRAGDSPAFGRERGDRRLDDLDFLAAERAAFARVRIETGDGEARLGDSEIALEPAQAPLARAIRSARWSARRGTSAKRQVRRDRDGAQRRTGEHHHDIAGRNPAALGDELGLAGMLEADGVELLLGHRAGDDCGGRAGARKPDGELQRIERAMRAGDARMPRHVRLGRSETWIRGSAYVERRVRLPRIIDDLDRAVPDGGDRAAVPDSDERRQSELGRGDPSIWRSPPGRCPPGSPSEIASGARRRRATAAALASFDDLAEFDDRVAAKVAQVAASADVHPLLVELAVDLVVARRRRVDFVAAANDERPHAFVQRAERLSGLADLHLQHHLLQRRGQVAHLHAVLLDDFAR